jgi:hypothetical protein
VVSSPTPPRRPALPTPPFAGATVGHQPWGIETLVALEAPLFITWLCFAELSAWIAWVCASIALTLTFAAWGIAGRRRDGMAMLWSGVLAATSPWFWLFTGWVRDNFFELLWFGRPNNAFLLMLGQTALATMLAALAVGLTWPVLPKAGVRARRTAAWLVLAGCALGTALATWGLTRLAHAPAFASDAWMTFDVARPTTTGPGPCPNAEGPCPPPPWATRLPCGTRLLANNGDSLEVSCRFDARPRIVTTLRRADGARVIRTCWPAAPLPCEVSACTAPRADGSPAGGECFSLSEWEDEAAYPDPGSARSVDKHEYYVFGEPDRWQSQAPIMVADALRPYAPPKVWIAAAASGVALAAMWLRRWRRIEAWVKALAAGKRATATGDGWAHPDDGSEPYRLPPEAEHLRGPLLILASEQQSGYRQHAQGVILSLAPGERGELVARAHQAASTVLLQALGALALTAAPLLAWLALVRG